METNLKGKVVLITGAASGIGRATALAFAKQGSRLALVDFDKPELEALCAEIKGEGGEATFGLGDLSTADGVKSGISAALGGKFDGVDVLFNNVGSGFVRTFDQLTDEDWEQDPSAQLHELCSRDATGAAGHAQARRWRHRQQRLGSRPPA